MIQKISKREITQKSFPFASAKGKLKFEEHGYVEEEFFFQGFANVYEECGKHEKKIWHQENKYVNRFILRRPKNMEKFSGNVVVEILNATAGFDIDRMWVLGAKELMRDQSVYVGITSRPEMLDTLCLFDQERYKELSWSVSYERPKFTGVKDPLTFPKYADRETGLFWDMLTDLVEYLKNTTEIIATEKRKYFYLAGWSQSANYMSTYIRYFLEDNKELFDGYLAAGNVHSFVTPLNQSGYSENANYELTKFDYMPAPCIAVQTETESAHLCGYECRQENSETKEFKYRCYELAGATHDTKYSLLDYYEKDERMKEIGLTPKYEGIHENPNDFPYQYPMNAIYRLLFKWVRENKTPPVCDRIEINENLDACVDEKGNAKGGVRTPFIDVPICCYHNASQMKLPNGEMGENPLFGYTEYFSKDKLLQMYQTKENYRKLFTESAEDAVKKGFLLAEDVENCVTEAVGRFEKIVNSKQ